MKQYEATWPEVGTLNRDTVVLIPTGSIEQHGHHLPLGTDSILATAVAEEVEKEIPDKVLLTPTVWLGASGHHLPFSGSLSASFEGYDSVLRAIILSLSAHDFYRFYIVNAHGGNTEPNAVTLRKLRMEFPNLQLGSIGYFHFIDQSVFDETLEGQRKGIRHACEAETSLMLHVRPDLVRANKLKDDGLEPSPAVPGMIWHFDEITTNGSLGEATRGTAEKGQILFKAAVSGLVEAVSGLYQGIQLVETEY